MTQVRVTFTICCLLMIQACKHPLSIQGQGDVIERLLEVRGCTLEEFESESPRCTDNGVTESDYVVSYEAVPRPGWVFTGWFGTVCSTTTEEGYCEYNLPQGFVDFINKEWPGIVLPPTTAVFHEDTGRSIIGSHYSTPILLIAHDSDDHPGLLNQPESFDLNGDGRMDVVFSTQDQEYSEGISEFVVMLADGLGALALSTDLLVTGGIPTTERGFRQIIPADFNGDGHLDLFLESHGAEPECPDGIPVPECWEGGVNSLLLSNGKGKLVNVTVSNLPAHSDFSHGSSVADFDRDGDVDIWVNNLGGSPLYNPEYSYLLQNDGKGRFSVGADVSGYGQTPIIGANEILPGESRDLGTFWSLTVDAEGDGDLDLGLGWSYGLGANIVLINDGDGRFPTAGGNSYPSPSDYAGSEVQHALVEDLNGDGLDDVLLHQSRLDLTDEVLQILISNGDGTFRDETISRYPGDTIGIGEFQLHDLNNDGHLDLFSNIGFVKNEIAINDGEGNFRPLANDWVQELGWNWVVLDVDGDGGSDFLNDSGGYGVALHRMSKPYGPNIDGTQEDDRLIGGAKNNVFRGMGGSDVLDSGLGKDSLHGGPGSDVLIGGKGPDSYLFEQQDLGGDDTIIDKAGKDKLVFMEFGLEEIAGASKDNSESLILDFISGGSIKIEGHFRGDGFSVEKIALGQKLYELSNDPGFKSGDLQDLLID